MNSNLQLAQRLRCNEFADRETFDLAMEYVDQIARGSDNPAAVWTAVMVVVNTIANEIEANEKQIA
jgi:hypothetical protein